MALELFNLSLFKLLKIDILMQVERFTFFFVIIHSDLNSYFSLKKNSVLLLIYYGFIVVHEPDPSAQCIKL